MEEPSTPPLAAVQEAVQEAEELSLSSQLKLVAEDLSVCCLLEVTAV